jgi:hypothetical protein
MDPSDIIKRVNDITRKIDSERGKNLSTFITSFFIIKVNDYKWRIPFSRKIASASGKYIEMIIYPGSLWEGNFCRLNIHDIESIDVVVSSSLRAFKKETKIRKKVINNITDSILNQDFNEDLF